MLEKRKEGYEISLQMVFIFLKLDRLEFSYPSRFPDRCCNSHHGSDGYDDSKFPVPLNGPEDYRISLEQIKGIQSLEQQN